MNTLHQKDFLNLLFNVLSLVGGKNFESTSLLYNYNFLVLPVQQSYFDNNDAHRIGIRRNKYSILKKQFQQYQNSFSKPLQQKSYMVKNHIQ